jgi:hypothetical protein
MNKNYEKFDRPEILNFLFHPRKEEFSGGGSVGEEIVIPVSGGESIGSKLFFRDPASPLILFFHGNGEIASDYDDLGPIFTSQGISFLVVDYRGYGRSTGSPAVSTMISDAHEIFDFTISFMGKRGITGKPFVMGRSLGSASALELAASRPHDMQGLIIESGFAKVRPLLKLLGINPDNSGITDESDFGHIEKISSYTGPLLVIHAEFDHIIPYTDGADLFAASTSAEKNMVTIKGANHNNIFMIGMNLYMSSIREFILKKQ